MSAVGLEPAIRRPGTDGNAVSFVSSSGSVLVSTQSDVSWVQSGPSGLDIIWKRRRTRGTARGGGMGWGGSGPPRLEQRLPRMAPRSQRHESVTLNKRLAVVPGLEPVTQTVWITDRRSVTHRHMTAIPPIRTFFSFHHACFQDVETQWTLSLRQSERQVREFGDRSETRWDTELRLVSFHWGFHQRFLNYLIIIKYFFKTFCLRMGFISAQSEPKETLGPRVKNVVQKKLQRWRVLNEEYTEIFKKIFLLIFLEALTCISTWLTVSLKNTTQTMIHTYLKQHSCWLYWFFIQFQLFQSSFSNLQPWLFLFHSYILLNTEKLRCSSLIYNWKKKKNLFKLLNSKRCYGAEFRNESKFLSGRWRRRAALIVPLINPITPRTISKCTFGAEWMVFLETKHWNLRVNETWQLSAENQVQMSTRTERMLK